MQLLPLSTDGRVVAVACTVAVAGPLRVALEPDRGGVGVVALGSGAPRPVARLAAPDAAAYRPVLQSLWTQGLVGSCPARVTATGQLVLHLAPATECVLGNSSAGLVLLAARRTVAVTREEHHQGVLVGRSGRVAVALAPCTIAAGEHAGQRGLEVLLDGRRVGELTRPVSQRYLPMVDELAARGRRAGCEAVLRPGDRGVRVELRLPAPDATVGDVATPAPPPARYPRTVIAPPRRGAGTAIVPAARRGGPAVPRDAPADTAVIPRQRAASEPTTPAPASTPGPASTPDTRPRRRAWWAGAATVGVLVVAAGVGTSADSATAPTTDPAVLWSASASPGSSATSVVPTDPSATTTTAPGTTARSRAGAGSSRRSRAGRPTTRATTSTLPRPAASRPVTTRAVTTRSATIREAAATRTRPPAPPAPPVAPPSACDPNYSGCVPVASDVDCEGGSGDGPAYVRGPVRVVGTDVYGLDRGGKPGIGCG